MLDGEQRRGATRRHADLGVDVLHVMVCGLGGDHETLRDRRTVKPSVSRRNPSTARSVSPAGNGDRVTR